MHTKRQIMPKSWPIPRKGTKYITSANHNKKYGIPIVVIMREVLKIVRTKKELQRIINERKLLVNNKEVISANLPVGLLDVISLPSIKKYYRLVLKNKKVGVVEINEKESESRIYKIISKKIISKDQVQLNLNLGKNILISPKENFETGTFLLFNNKTKKIEKSIKLDKKSKVVIIAGKHIGKEGEVVELSNIGEKNVAEVIVDKGEKINVELKNLFVLS